jgi:hypothetical protein
MRKLSLDEKISLKGIFARKGLFVPKLDMEQAIFLFGMCCGRDITRWHQYSVNEKLNWVIFPAGWRPQAVLVTKRVQNHW